MAGLRFADLQSRPTEFLDFTSLTLDEFQQLVPPFEAAFQAHMASWRLDGKPRTARQFAVYTNCPLPTPEDRLLFILAYIKTYSLQVVQGRLFSMGQSKANQWIHVLLPVLLAALRTLGDAPTRSLTAKPRQHMVYIYASLSRLDFQGLSWNATIVFFKALQIFPPQQSQSL